MSRGDIILRLVELTKVYYGNRKVTALDNISTSFKRGEFVAVVGRSGSGKSTLINILGGLDSPTKGDYYCEGNNVSRLNEEHWDALRNKKIGFIFQNYHLIEYLTVYQNVEVALQFQNIPQSMKDAKIREIIEKVGLRDHINKHPSQLSGGQRQRVAVARALVKDPDIILADEPTGALDWKTADEVIKLLKGESEDRLVVMVTHDRSIANKYANRIIEIENGVFKQDLVKEEIEQTYQNVFRKIRAVNLKAKDKFIMTFNKIKSNLIRNFFISLSLALAFSFSIIFNGLDRGVRDSYFNFYETLDKTDSNSFSIITNNLMSASEFDNYNTLIETNLEEHEAGNDIVKGYSRDVIGYNKLIFNIEKINLYPDLLDNIKLRLLTTKFDKYSHDELFIYNSEVPLSPNTLMATSRFIKEYYNLDSYKDVDKYLNQTIELPKYSVYRHEKLNGIRDLLNKSYEVGDYFDNDDVENPDMTYISYLDLNVPYYCYEKETLGENDLSYCKSIFNSHQLFSSYEDYIDYMDYFKAQIESDEYYEILKHSDAIFYFNNTTDPNYIKKIYSYIYNELYYSYYITDAFYLDTQEKTKFKITAIIDNEYESLVYMTDSNYNRMFKNDSSIDYVSSFYTINYLDSERDRKTNSFKRLGYYSHELRKISLINHDKVETNACSVEVVTDAKTGENSILKSIFYINDYLNCGQSSTTSSYLNMTNNLFSLFFNILMIASVVFYSMLIRVIFKARINEIGVFRSVGSTIKDIKRLFFYEVLYIFTTASILSFAILYFIVKFINGLFIQFTSLTSRVISFSNIHLLLNENISIVNISYINLIVQIVIVVSLILYLSNRNISKVVNTNPIDILREVV